jgi:hypothetical protein
LENKNSRGSLTSILIGSGIADFRPNFYNSALGARMTAKHNITSGFYVKQGGGSGTE